MLQLNFLVIIVFFIASCFILLSKNKENKKRKWFLLINLLIIAWDLTPYLIKTQNNFLNILWDWSPLIFLPILHRETALLTTAFTNDTHDVSFIQFEKKYFPTIINFHNHNHGNNKFVSETLHACYLSFYVMIYGIPLYFYINRDFLAFYTSTFAILLSLFACFITHGIIPVHGPRNIYVKINDHRSHGIIFRLVHKILEDGSTAGTAFPSGHVTVAFSAILITWYLSSPLFYVILPIGIGLIVSTVYGRFHYVVDIIAGVIYSLITIFITAFIFRIF